MTYEATVGHNVPTVAARIVGDKRLCAAFSDCEAHEYRQGYCGTHHVDMWRHGHLVRPAVSMRCLACGVQLPGGLLGRQYCTQQCRLLHNRYGVRPDTHARIMAAQRCDGCGRPATYGGRSRDSLHVDHCHDGAVVRGLLDQRCNQVLGWVEDSVDLLLALAAYAENVTGQLPDDIPALLTEGGCDLCGEPKLARRIGGGGKPIRYCGAVCRSKGSAIRDNYGLEPERYRHLLRSQNGRCAACSFPFGAAVLLPVLDHDHTDGRIRGIIHGRCNTALGLATESPVVLRSLADYLTAPPLAHAIVKRRREPTIARVTPTSKTHSTRWWSKYSELVRYYETHGHEPGYLASTREGLLLHTWITTQRVNFKKRLLAADRADALAALPGWTWTRNRPWTDSYADFVTHVRTQGRLPADTRVADAAERVCARWMYKQRTMYRDGRLTSDQIARLDAISGWGNQASPRSLCVAPIEPSFLAITRAG